MRLDFNDGRSTPYYLFIFLLVAVFYFPLRELQGFLSTQEATYKFIQRLVVAKQGVDMDLQLDEFLVILAKTSFSGTWASDMKQSKLLEQDKGTIEMKAKLIDSSDPSKGSFLLVNIFDGSHRDQGHYELKIEGRFIKSDLTFTENGVIFQAKSHLIG